MSVPNPPTVNELPLSSNGTLEFQWYAPASGPTVDSYTLNYVDELNNTGSIPGITGTYRLVSGLVNGRTYTFNVQAVNGAGSSDAVYFIPFQPGADIPGIPVSVSSTVTGPGTILVTWNPPSQSPDATIFWYVLVSSSSNQSDPVVERTAGGNQRSLLVTGLNPGSAYSFTVTAVNCPGYGPGASTVPEGPTPESANEYVTDTVQNIGPTTNITQLQGFLSGFTASNPAPVPVITEPSVLITTFVGTAAPGFDANTTYETNFVLLTDNTATVNTSALTPNSVLYFPMTPGTPVILTANSTPYTIVSSGSTISVDGTPYALGAYVTLGGVSFQVAFTGSIGLLVATPSPPSSGMVDLGVLSGGTSSIATAVSGDGSIVVGYGTVASGKTKTFTYQGGTMTELNLPIYPTTNFFATGVSGNGNIIVGYKYIVGAASAFKYVGGTITTLQNIPGGTYSLAKAISSDGTVIVGISEESGQDTAVAYYSSGTTPTRLDAYYDYLVSQATAVSSDGSVIVGYGLSGNSGIIEAFYVSGGTLTSFSGIFGGYYSYATGVSANGTLIVGYFNDSDSSPSTQQGFIYTVGGSYIQIDAPANIPAYSVAGLIFTTITGISADGTTVVGYASSGINSGDERAFKYTVSGAVYEDLGLLSGGSTAIAKAVSSNGSIIVGQARTSGSELHAFKYTA